MASLLNNLVFYFLCGEVLLLLLLLLPMPGSLRRVMLRWVALSRSIGQHTGLTNRTAPQRQVRCWTLQALTTRDVLQVASSRLLAAIARPLSYLAFAVVAMFVMVTREMLAHQAAWAERKREPADKAGLGLGVSSLEVRMLRSQRNWRTAAWPREAAPRSLHERLLMRRYLSGFACVLMLVIW